MSPIIGKLDYLNKDKNESKQLLIHNREEILKKYQIQAYRRIKTTIR